MTYPKNPKLNGTIRNGKQKEYKMTHKKDPRLNGWKSKGFYENILLDLTDKEHAEVVYMYEACSKMTGIEQKDIFQMLIRDYYNEVTKIILESNYDLIEKPITDRPDSL